MFRYVCVEINVPGEFRKLVRKVGIEREGSEAKLHTDLNNYGIPAVYLSPLNNTYCKPISSQ